MADLPATEMLYMTYEGNQLTEYTATVLQVDPPQDNNPLATVILDQTVLHAQGGGQPTDLGTISKEGSTFQVKKVVTDRSTGVTFHTGNFEEGQEGFAAGDKVQVKVDVDTRRILSECHTGKE